MTFFRGVDLKMERTHRTAQLDYNMLIRDTNCTQ